MYMYLRLTSTEENFKNGGGGEGYKHILLCLSSWLSPCPLIVISFSGSDAIVFVYYVYSILFYALMHGMKYIYWIHVGVPLPLHITMGEAEPGQFMCTCKSIQVNKD